MTESYKRLPIDVFGRELIASEDLDPVYCALHRTDWSEDLMCRWMLAYWCYYDCGVASFIAEREGDDFWELMLKAARNEEPTPIGGRWRRAAERRHARGKAAVKMVYHLQGRYGNQPENAVHFMATGWTPGVPTDERNPTCRSIMKRAKSHHLFGNWIGFKVADMVDRVIGTHVDFSEGEVFMFKDPAKAAVMAFRIAFFIGDDEEVSAPEAIRWAVTHLQREFRDLTAPPAHDRRIGLQEVETVLCKWKSSMNGHYPLLNDINEIREHIQPWTKYSVTAREFLEAMPSGSTTQ